MALSKRRRKKVCALPGNGADSGSGLESRRTHMAAYYEYQVLRAQTNKLQPEATQLTSSKSLGEALALASKASSRLGLSFRRTSRNSAE